MAEFEREDQSAYVFNMSLETLRRINYQLWEIYMAKKEKNINELFNCLVILEQELVPFFVKLKQREEKLKKMNDIKNNLNKSLKRYNNYSRINNRIPNSIFSDAYSKLVEYDSTLRIFMQELKILMVEMDDPRYALLGGR